MGHVSTGLEMSADKKQLKIARKPKRFLFVIIAILMGYMIVTC
jgi:hypothetical protein